MGATSGAAVLLDLAERAQACCHKFVTASRNFVPASCSVWDFADSASRAARYFAIHSCSESHCVGGVAMAWSSLPRISVIARLRLDGKTPNELAGKFIARNSPNALVA